MPRHTKATTAYLGLDARLWPFVAMDDCGHLGRAVGGRVSSFGLVIGAHEYQRLAGKAKVAYLRAL